MTMRQMDISKTDCLAGFSFAHSQSIDKICLRVICVEQDNFRIYCLACILVPFLCLETQSRLHVCSFQKFTVEQPGLSFHRLRTLGRIRFERKECPQDEL